MIFMWFPQWIAAPSASEAMIKILAFISSASLALARSLSIAFHFCAKLQVIYGKDKLRIEIRRKSIQTKNNTSRIVFLNSLCLIVKKELPFSPKQCLIKEIV